MSALALLLGATGCQTVLEANGGYSAALTGSGARHRGSLNLRWAVGAADDTPGSGEPLEHRHALVDIQVLRLRVGDGSGRVAFPAGGIYAWVGDREVAYLTLAAGVSLFDIGWGVSDGFGMFSPHGEVGGAVLIYQELALTAHIGLEYPVRFSGPQEELYLTTGLGVSLSIL